MDKSVNKNPFSGRRSDVPKKTKNYNVFVFVKYIYLPSFAVGDGALDVPKKNHKKKIPDPARSDTLFY